MLKAVSEMLQLLCINLHTVTDLIGGDAPMIPEGYHPKGWGVAYSQESIERVLDYIRDGAPAKDEPPDSVCVALPSMVGCADRHQILCHMITLSIQDTLNIWDGRPFKLCFGKRHMLHANMVSVKLPYMVEENDIWQKSRWMPQILMLATVCG